MALMTLGANAQITTGESTSKVVRTGNRAQAGNFGIYFGGTTDMFKSIFSGEDVNFSALPLINLKYMGTDKLEYRLGLEWWNKTTSTSVTFDGEKEGSTTTVDTSNGESSFMFYPGIAYHFNNKNLLDVYVGGELPFGFAGYSFDNDDTDGSTSNFRIGLGAFIGLQAYIANLPIALGLEYGISTLYNTVSNGALSQDGMTIDYNNGNYYKEDWSQSRWTLGHQIRVTLSYYFNL